MTSYEDLAKLTREQKYDILTKDFLERDGDTFVRIRQTDRLGWEDTLPKDSPYSAMILNPKSDRELYKNAMNLARQMIVAMDTPFKVNVYIDSDMNCTDSHSVFVATKVFDDPDLTLGQKLDTFLGATIHEGSHLLYTDWETVKNSKHGNRVLHDLQNILEDEMIERRLGEHKPGLANFLKATKYYYFGKYSKQVDTARLNDATRLVNAILALVRYPASLTPKDIEDFSDELIIAREILTPYPENTEQCNAKALEIYGLLKKFMQKQEEEQEQEESEQKQNGKGKGEGQSNQSKGSGQSGSDGEEQDEDEDEGEGESSENGQSQKGSKQGKGKGKGKSKDSDESGSDNGGQEEGQDENGEDQSEGTDEGSDGEEQDEDEDEGEDKSSGKKKSGRNSNQSEGNDSGTGKQEPSDKDVENALDAILKAIEDNLSKDPTEPGKNGLDKDDMADATKRDRRKIAKECDGQLEIGDTPNVILLKKDPNRRRYEESYRRINKYIPATATILRQKATSYEYNLSGLRNGRLDTNKLAEARQGVQTVYMQKGRVNCDKTNLVLLIDESGSMHGLRSMMAMDTAVLISEAMKSIPIVNTYIYGYTENRDTVLFPYKEEGKPFDKYTLGSVDSYSNTPTSEAIRECVSRVRKRSKEQTLLFVISDGCANTGEGPVRQEVEKAKNSGFTTIGISISSALSEARLKAMYDHYIVVNDISTLARDLGIVIKKQILNKTKRRSI